jgi:hypothetical protein
LLDESEKHKKTNSIASILCKTDKTITASHLQAAQHTLTLRLVVCNKSAARTAVDVSSACQTQSQGMEYVS